MRKRGGRGERSAASSGDAADEPGKRRGQVLSYVVAALVCVAAFTSFLYRYQPMAISSRPPAPLAYGLSQGNYSYLQGVTCRNCASKLGYASPCARDCTWMERSDPFAIGSGNLIVRIPWPGTTVASMPQARRARQQNFLNRASLDCDMISPFGVSASCGTPTHFGAGRRVSCVRYRRYSCFIFV